MRSPQLLEAKTPVAMLHGLDAGTDAAPQPVQMGEPDGAALLPPSTDGVMK